MINDRINLTGAKLAGRLSLSLALDFLQSFTCLCWRIRAFFPHLKVLHFKITMLVIIKMVTQKEM